MTPAQMDAFIASDNEIKGNSVVLALLYTNALYLCTKIIAPIKAISAGTRTTYQQAKLDRAVKAVKQLLLKTYWSANQDLSVLRNAIQGL